MYNHPNKPEPSLEPADPPSCPSPDPQQSGPKMSPFIPPSNPLSLSLAPSTSILIPEDRAITSLIQQLLDRSGLSQAEAARRLGLNRVAFQRFWRPSRTCPSRPSLPSIKWLLKLAAVCGAKVVVEFPAVPLP